MVCLVLERHLDGSNTSESVETLDDYGSMEYVWLRREKQVWQMRVTLEEKRPGCCSAVGAWMIVGMTQAHLPAFVEKST